ncbi:MAG: TetR/AcrR family transcriptional regulator [Micromonosporaceae bacterium]
MVGDEELGRTARKRRAILDAARSVFLRKGYAGTSMDEVAALAAVSKQTVYKQFTDKERLFTEIIHGVIGDAEESSVEIFDELTGSEDLPDALRRFAREHLAVVMGPEVVRMRRVIIGEADRFPDLARTWYDRAPARAERIFADCFAELTRQGRLRVADPRLAAQHFNWLVLSVPLNQAMFDPDVTFTSRQLHAYADEAVRIFLAAHTP